MGVLYRSECKAGALDMRIAEKHRRIAYAWSRRSKAVRRPHMALVLRTSFQFSISG